ncbi:Phosphotransferase enzyme family protein [Asanoa hainanensis]|uniref:Phosphotransferase enzyme family protein n=1 Tax=Asanoa hainanensis TaxID=560556 RepID=A0A239NFM9_9ACTN|nr:aminoglycoside phosphotransferase family protein [Asanoa hainanensis]SNT53332.1 Phosphotransferase enzyme family protein [Asanoa hainanensis]
MNVGLEPRTTEWVQAALPPGHEITAVTALRGGWTSRMSRLDVEGPDTSYPLVLRSFLKPFYVRHAPGLLAREAAILRLLAGTSIPAPRPLAVDPAGETAAYPSLLMSLLKGRVDLTVDRSAALARQLVEIHKIAHKPRTYQAWTDPDRVRVPDRDTALWRHAVDLIRREPPPWEGRFLHRDFHPGNVLFDKNTITGVVDWVETSWGPADLDVAHCATAIALLHGPEQGMKFAGHYQEAGGVLGDEHRYWRLLDALGFAPDAEKVAGPWRDLGRTDLTPDVLTRRLTEYVAAAIG